MFSCLYYYVIIWFFSFNLEWVVQKAEIEAPRAILAFWQQQQQHWLYFYNTEKAFVAFEKLTCANWFQIELETVRLPIHNINMTKMRGGSAGRSFLKQFFHIRENVFSKFSHKSFVILRDIIGLENFLFVYLISESKLLFLTFQVFHVRISYETLSVFLVQSVNWRRVFWWSSNI